MEARVPSGGDDLLLPVLVAGQVLQCGHVALLMPWHAWGLSILPLKVALALVLILVLLALLVPGWVLVLVPVLVLDFMMGILQRSALKAPITNRVAFARKTHATRHASRLMPLSVCLSLLVC
jgi:hypothetical protein